MKRRWLLDGGAIALLAAGAAFVAMAPGDLGGPMEARRRVRGAESSGPSAPAGTTASARPEGAPPSASPPGGTTFSGAPSGGVEAGGSAVTLASARTSARGLGVQLEGARVVLPDDDDGASAAVLDRAFDELAAVEAALAEGTLSPDDAQQRVLQIRLDAALGFDGAAEPADALALKQALGFDMSEGDELGWGVPLTEANFGQIFGEDAGGVE
jgi:hypothetical protein